MSYRDTEHNMGLAAAAAAEQEREREEALASATDDSIIEVVRTLVYRGPRKWIHSTLGEPNKGLKDGVNEMGPQRFITITTGEPRLVQR